jgi:hypothetical protein
MQNLHKDANVGVDPCCISVDTAHRWQQAFSKHDQKLVPLKENLVDKVWENRPAHVVAPVCIQPLEFTGRTAKDKICDLRGKLDQEKAFAIVVTTLDEVRFVFLHLFKSVTLLHIQHVNLFYFSNSFILLVGCSYLTACNLRIFK